MAKEDKTEIDSEQNSGASEETMNEAFTVDASSELMKALADTQAEVEKYKNEYLRARADQENLRKRFVREKEMLIKSANMNLIEEFLPVLDALGLAMQAAEGGQSAADIQSGIQMLVSQTQSILGNHGLKDIDPAGESFDPNFHECVAHTPHEEVEENKVIEVHRKGYLLYDRLLRPAMVVVSSGKNEESQE